MMCLADYAQFFITAAILVAWDSFLETWLLKSEASIQSYALLGVYAQFKTACGKL